jgi:hypothetical protein
MPFSSEQFRHKTVQALSRNLLETAVKKLESEGWRRMGNVALAKPVSETQPPYLVQAMVHGLETPPVPPPA